MNITMSKAWLLVVVLVSGFGGGAVTGLVLPSRAEIENAVRQAYESSARDCELHAARGDAEYVDRKGKGY